jgi:hypothetical protein
MDRKATVQVFFLLIALMVIVAYMFITGKKGLFIPAFIIMCIIVFSVISYSVGYIKSYIYNYNLWYKSDEGMISGWPDPKQLGRNINVEWIISDVEQFPLGGYWRYTYKSPSGALEYLNLTCAPKNYRPGIDLDLTNVLKFRTHNVEPRSPAQERTADRQAGYKGSRDVKTQLKNLKNTLGTDAYNALYGRRRRNNRAG